MHLIHVFIISIQGDQSLLTHSSDIDDLLEGSLVGVGLELALLADSRNGEVAFLILGHVAGIQELLDQGGSRVARRLLVLHHLDLDLHGLVVGELGRDLLLLEERGLLLFLDLLLGASSFATRLEQVGRDTLVCYGNEGDEEEEDFEGTYC